jgi:hypothetical protein
MRRSFNYTGRKEIPSDLVKITLQRGATPDELPRFSADLSRLGAIGLDPNAKVYIEPYVSAGTTMRFAIGTVGTIHVPDDTLLSDLDAGTSILFRVKVIDEGKDPCPIVASANQLRPLEENEEQDDRRAILPVRETADLGEALWDIEILSDAGPELLINNTIPGLLERLRTDPLAQGFILPHALKSILEYIFLKGEVDDEQWVESWREFAGEISGSAPPEPDEILDDDEEVKDFVNKCLRAFCERQQFRTMARCFVLGGDDV